MGGLRSMIEHFEGKMHSTRIKLYSTNRFLFIKWYRLKYESEIYGEVVRKLHELVS